MDSPKLSPDEWIDQKTVEYLNIGPLGYYPKVNDPPHPNPKEYHEKFGKSLFSSWDNGGSIQNWFEMKGNTLQSCRALVRGDGKIFPYPSCHSCEGRVYSPYRATQVQKGNEVFLEGITTDGYFYKPHNNSYDNNLSLWQRLMNKIW